MPSLARLAAARNHAALAAALLAALVLGACGGTGEPPLACDAQAYELAVRDSAEPTAASISTRLWAIVPDNPRLVWNLDASAVRMVVWTTWRGYQPGDLTLSREVWLTPAPQLREMCQGVDPGSLVARVNQILGMPPPTTADAGRYFVEMWVKPADLFRPCPDPEIDDTTCGLTFPASATAEHRAWIASQFAASHGFWQSVHYPWTGLGYTYDWCNPATREGASEFVVRAGSTVTVTGLFPRETYCAP